MTRPVNIQLFVHKRILVATDFLESSRLALDYAVGFAHRYGARIILFHCLELSQAALEVEMEGKASLVRKAAAERLEALAAGVRRNGIDAAWEICVGFPADVLPDWTQKFPVDLLVLGTHGIHRGLSHLLVGSNTEKILLAAKCPTLTVGRHVLAGVDTKLKFDEILYVADFTQESIAAAPYALALGRDFHTFVDICQITPRHTSEDPAAMAKLVEEYCEQMEQTLSEDNHRWSSSVFQLDRTHAGALILERAQANPSALIVLGVKTKSWLDRHLNTSFAYELLSKATCPILTIHPGERTIAAPDIG
jgi:nucleotide-binding universal stress UspA family protein